MTRGIRHVLTNRTERARLLAATVSWAVGFALLLAGVPCAAVLAVLLGGVIASAAIRVETRPYSARHSRVPVVVLAAPPRRR